MIATAKIFTTGNSQAIRLPKAFRVQASEVWISKDDISGVITLRPKDENERKKNLSELFRLIREQPFTEDFIPPRSTEMRPNPFADWEAPTPPKSAKPTKPIKSSKPAKTTKAAKPTKRVAKAAK
jgi:antitoxin VapB